MIIIKYQDIDSPANLNKTADLVLHHGLMVYPTDTLYGLGGDFFSESAIRKIDRFKGRSSSPYSIAVSDIEMLAEFVDQVPELFKELYKKFLPGKVTVLLKASAAINRKLLKGSDKIGIRIPNSPPILRLMKFIQHPLISTSVNLHGSPPLNSPDKILTLFAERKMSEELSLLIDNGPMPPSAGSTVIDLSGNKVSIVRRGDDYHRISSFLQKF